MTEDSMLKYYRVRAPEYEQIYYRDVPARRAEIDAEAKRLSGLVTDRKVLELACGTGYWTEIMSRTAASITASDISPEMLDEAARKSFDCQVSFVQADMFQHSFGEKCYDIVALGFWLSHQLRQEYDRLLDILVQPLAKNGRIWMIDNNPPAEGNAFPSLKTDDRGNHYQTRSLPDGQEFVILKNYFSRDDLESLFKPRFKIEVIEHNRYYWSAVLTL